MSGHNRGYMVEMGDKYIFSCKILYNDFDEDLGEIYHKSLYKELARGISNSQKTTMKCIKDRKPFYPAQMYTKRNIFREHKCSLCGEVCEEFYAIGREVPSILCTVCYENIKMYSDGIIVWDGLLDLAGEILFTTELDDNMSMAIVTELDEEKICICETNQIEEVV